MRHNSASGILGICALKFRVGALRLVFGLLIGTCFPLPMPATEHRYEIVVVGATAGGVVAAVQAKKMGKSVVLIEAGTHVGGLTSGGLGATDIGNKRAIGGVSREFYRRVRAYYRQPNAWKFERASDYRSGRNSETDDEDTMWTFEPHVAEKILREMLAECEVPLHLNKSLDRTRPALRKERDLTAITTQDGDLYYGRRFIDATYEGDLLALAGVSHHVGREANTVYQETLNGVQTQNAIKHQLMPGVDPYVCPGDPTSGLLPGVHGDGPGDEGTGDRRVQAYCFRMCLTDVPENRIPFEKPVGYDESRFELSLRNFEAGETRVPWSPFLMPNRKTDTNNNFGFSTDNLNQNYDWPSGDDARRQAIFAEHLLYQRGLMWTLANHPRVPAAVRNEVGRWGNCKDEFPDFLGWSHQLYVREARRMISDCVMTQNHCQGRNIVEDAVGLAAYGMDSHNVQRYVDRQGQARNEGDVQVHGFTPYPIALAAIVPKAAECSNLVVPICLSASHIAYGSIRMEPVFMVLGQSAATVACHSLDENRPVQLVDYARLADRLRADGQVLSWTK